LNIIEKSKATPSLPTLLTLGEALETDVEAELVPLLIERLRATQKKPGPPTQRSRVSKRLFGKNHSFE
jgi:hypothetical protein